MKKLELLTGKLTNSKFEKCLFSFLNKLVFIVSLGSLLTSCVINPIANSESKLNTPPNSSFIPTIKPSLTKTLLKAEPEIEIIKTEANLPAYPTSVSSELNINSPLKDISLEELPDILSNPFQRPSSGKDDGHPGVDFSFYSYRSWDTINHHDVLSVFSGKIAGITNNRPPYGYAIIIETDINLLGNEQKEIFQSMYPDTPFQKNIIFSCPDLNNRGYDQLKSELSLYVLYGHLSTIQEFDTSDEIVSGEVIGQVGNTGNSGNPHLHLEIRIGPKSATFKDMAHYDNSVTNEEIENYCLWRVSGYFYPIDPFTLLFQNHTKP